MTIERKTVDVAVGHTVTVHHEFAFHGESTNRLLVILPGRKYSPAHPALYHLQKAALENGYDVLALQYGFQVAPDAYGNDDIDLPMLLDEARRPFRAIVDRGYRYICFAGKSLSTPVAVAMCGECPVQETRLILLTPVSDAVDRVGDVETLVVIGTADPLYDAALIARDKRPNVRWQVFENLDHALEVEGDWRASLAALPDVIGACEGFLRKVKPA